VNCNQECNHTHIAAQSQQVNSCPSKCLAFPEACYAMGAWSFRLASMAAQAAGWPPAPAVSHDDRQWRHQIRMAKAQIAAPGAVPLLTPGGDFVADADIRAVGHPARELTVLPASRLRSQADRDWRHRDREDHAATSVPHLPQQYLLQPSPPLTWSRALCATRSTQIPMTYRGARRCPRPPRPL
jgi:hypothetical protein